LLAAKRFDRPAKSISNTDYLTTEECLRFLVSLPKGSKSGEQPIYVWFAFNYDINMILGDLPLKGETESIEELRKTNQTYYRGYKITYIPGKIFKLNYNGRTFHSTDIFSFFQTSFEKALSDWNISNPEIITKGKAARQDFSTWEMADIKLYNDAELDTMSELAEKLRAAVTPLNLTVRSWHGPGALAGAFLGKHKAANYLGDIPNDLYEIATRAYFGGRIDAAGYGFVEPVYHYDIVSAYPAAIRYLPDISSLKWRYSKGRPPSGSLYVSRIKWELQDTQWGAFPWRTKNGTIRFPLRGEGWYWSTEIEAAIARFPADCFTFVETWYAVGILSTPFFNVVQEAFEYRNELKKQGHSSNIAIKLILNSLYGKFAQTIGKAKYYSPIWAGLITALTRAKISAVITDDCVCTMTDSLWSVKPLNITPSKELGEWEQQEETKLVLAEAGLYQAHSPDGSRFIWQRGFDKRTPVDIEGIVTNWLGVDPTFEGAYKVNRFIGMGLASITSYPWRHWLELERKIQPVPLTGTTKRLPLYPLDSDEEPSQGFQRLAIRPADEEGLSYPYSKLTLDPSLTVLRLSDECEDIG
jgi:DNA polymerase type B, organellar and viral